MRAFPLFGVALLIASALPATVQADGMPAAPTVQRPHRHVHHVRHRRAPVAVQRHWAWYQMRVPNPVDPVYDRAMVLNYRSPAVNGERLAEGGYPPTPPPAGAPYFWRYGDVVYQYDGMADAWIQLSRYDAQRLAALVR
jgi:hypothetical protein